VLYSAAFRRLQRKTQVFPLEENAAIRSRLTHSLEVAHVGKYLATTVLSKFRERKKSGQLGIDEECSLAFANVIETACLLHDIGNPPFGHFGEAAISNWYSSYAKRSSKKVADSGDFTFFDGNPEGFRIITRLAGADGSSGMNLTMPQIAATVKYPITPDQILEGSPLRKKAGIFFSEAGIWDQVRSALNLAKGRRFPLAYLMEAADDISYCLSDIEDGIEKGIIFSHSDVVESIIRKISDADAIRVVEGAKDQALKHVGSVDPAVSFRSNLVRFMVDNAAEIYVTEHERIFDGARDGLVEANSVSGHILKAIKSTVAEMLYGRPASHRIELTGHAAITGILKEYECVLDLAKMDFQKIFADGKCHKQHEQEMRLISLLPKKHRIAYQRAMELVPDDDKELSARIHLIIDFVAGMTDVFALRTYQDLSGIRS